MHEINSELKYKSLIVFVITLWVRTPFLILALCASNVQIARVCLPEKACPTNIDEDNHIVIMYFQGMKGGTTFNN